MGTVAAVMCNAAELSMLRGITAAAVSEALHGAAQRQEFHGYVVLASAVPVAWPDNSDFGDGHEKQFCRNVRYEIRFGDALVEEGIASVVSVFDFGGEDHD
jgi:hypothetical protein